MLAENSANGAMPAAGPDSLIQDVTTNSFRQDVMQESMHQPVLVDFWAPWCGPCKQLTPILEKAVKAAGGKVKLAKMNIDEHPQIAGQLGVKSIPAVYAFDRGQPVDGFMGALPEGQVKAFIERLIGPVGPSATDEMLAEAAALVEAGDVQGAAGLYMAILEQEPETVAALAALAKLMIEGGDLDGARQLLDSVAADKAKDAAVAGARAALDLASQAEALGDVAELQLRADANPEDHQARFDLALALNARDRRTDAVDALLEIVKRDRTWSDDGAVKQLRTFFEAWGLMDPDAIRGRRRLSSYLFS